jgi:propionyl-CoA carboxylase alpha chain/3-methylcrotonyl-CoA carboxylase alpha subunit/acetyl-CoA/propionyl-CoA carboxylase biotin carboxyl carrier protein
MGDKITARNFAARHGVPVAPSVTQDGSLEAFLGRAEAIGFPLLIKAAAGGGGKGMKIARSAPELAENARLAASEAERYFRDGRIYAERLVETPRHIEVQVLGDGEGRAVHLFERECSLQRRYQKILEEAPAPNLPAALRDRMCEAAVTLAEAARYKNAGTIEFILAPDGEFYFLEMNTRLQVEHPVTEAILGLDLVAEQLKIAAGSGLSRTQDQVRVTGHAIECRICAEEPDKDFRPATGRIGVLRLPAGDTVRFDGGIREGQTVSASFDSMLAKLIVHGATRQEAVERMHGALRDLAVLGVPTNIDYLARLMTHPEFVAGRLDTGFLGRHAAWLQALDPPPPLEAAVLAATMLADTDFRHAAFDLPEPHASIGPWRN